ncbi:MAG: polysaccharide biosynthesis protein [bacterium]
MDDELLPMIGRRRPLFEGDLAEAEQELTDRIRSSSFLVLGGAGSIGHAVVKELFRRGPRRLHVVDISENNLVELVRDLRSSLGYIEGDFRTLALDGTSPELRYFVQNAPPYSHVLNLAAMKHVRSERDPYTLMRMVCTNVLMTAATMDLAIERRAQRYFAVSTDKAVNPTNAMGATKRVMELLLAARSDRIGVSSARFANVAFSDGSLLHGFGLRLAKRQPLSAPEDVLRYFITAHEGAILCLMACLLSENRECFFPAPGDDFEATSFRRIAEKYLEGRGYHAHPCASEEEARDRVEELAAQGEWPCYFFRSDTTGEKILEEFRSPDEAVSLERFREIGVVQWQRPQDSAPLEVFLKRIESLRGTGGWGRSDILRAWEDIVPEFHHRETGKFLDDRM